MVSSFAELLSGAGFQKYIVQHEFATKRDLYRAANVAFWSSMVIALALVLVVALCRDTIATLVGSPGLGIPLAVASLSLPLSVLVSSQQALFRRAFEYKKLFPVRITVAAVPLVVAVPLAMLGWSYWALVIATLAAALVNAVCLTVLSPWKPRWSFSRRVLRDMWGYSAWSLLESIAVWATLWSGTFIVANVLTAHELGLYRQPILVVNSAFAIVTSATTPVLFAALARLQTDRDRFRGFFFPFQLRVAVVLFPIGILAFFYRDALTAVLFGPDWSAAALMFGTWALSTSFVIVFAHYSSEIFRALGRPRVSFLAQCIYMAVMIPALYWGARGGFDTLAVVAAVVRIVYIAINQTLTKVVAGFGFLRATENLHAPLVAAIAMGAVAAWTAALAEGSLVGSAMGILACAVVYFLVCLCFPTTRGLLLRAVRALTTTRRAG